MKSLLTSAFLSLSLAAALSAAPTTSEETKAKVLADAPKYDPAIHAAAEKQKQEEGAMEEEIVVMEELTVQEKSVRRLEEESLFKRGAWDKELKKRELSELDRMLLNRYTLSANFGPVGIGVAGAKSAADRAREEYNARKNREFQERAKNFSDVLKTTDEKEASDLRELMIDNARSGQGMENTAKPSNWR